MIYSRNSKIKKVDKNQDRIMLPLSNNLLPLNHPLIGLTDSSHIKTSDPHKTLICIKLMEFLIQEVQSNQLIYPKMIPLKISLQGLQEMMR